MKKYLFKIAFLVVGTINCSGQNVSLDLNKIRVYNDTLFFDINNDGHKDALVKFVYKYKEPIPKGESGQILALFINNDKNKYIYSNKNNAALWLIHTEIKSIDSKTFIINNIGARQEWYRYYCYFQYDENKKNWFLIKQEIYQYDDKERKLINRKTYNEENKLAFELVSFDKLFGKFRSEIIEDNSYYSKIKPDKAFIYNNSKRL